MVERAFGHLKGRFRRLKQLQLFNEVAISKVIFAGCILHNFCVLTNDQVEDYIEIEHVDDAHPNNYPPVYQNAENGVQLRDRLVQQLHA